MTGRNKILCLVEGQVAEPKFFRNFALQLGLDVAIYQVRTNVYALYQKLKHEAFQLDIKKVAAEMATSERDKSVLSGDYQRIYLVYDCDLQHSQPRGIRAVFSRKRALERNLTIVEEMIRHCNDEYDATVGKLLINYPMFESYADTNAFFMREFGSRRQKITTGKSYKQLISRRVIAQKKLVHYSADDFRDLVTQNAHKLVKMVLGEWRYPTYSEFQEIATQERIFEVQRELARRSHCVEVINTSILLPLVTYLESAGYYSKFMNPRRNRTLSIIVPVDAKPSVGEMEKFISRMKGQSFQEWECLIVVPKSIASCIRGVMCGDSRFHVVETSDLHGKADLLADGIRLATGEKIMFTTIKSVPVWAGLITLMGLFQVYEDADIVTFERNGFLRSMLHHWKNLLPELKRRPTTYSVSDRRSVREFCQCACRGVCAANACYSSALLRDPRCPLADILTDKWMSGLISYVAGRVVRSGAVLFSQ